MTNTKKIYKKVSLILAVVSLSLTGFNFFNGIKIDAQSGPVTNPRDSFNLRFNQNVSGGLTFTGNSQCIQKINIGDSTNNVCGAFTTLDTTQRVSGYPAGTTLDWASNSSSANLELPAGSHVLYADLVWGGMYRYNNEVSGVDTNIATELAKGVTLKKGAVNQQITPNDSDIKQIIHDQNQSFYTVNVNVTDLIRSSGAGTYVVSGIPSLILDDDQTSSHAGWTLAVAYENASLPVRNISIYSGPVTVRSGTPSEVVKVSGFSTPATGQMNGRLLFSAQEGDSTILGDDFLFGKDSNDMSNVQGPNNPRGNFFRSQINGDDGRVNTTGSFGNANQGDNQHNPFMRQGWDISNVDISNYLETNQTSAYAQGTSNGDTYLMNALGIQIDVYAPSMQASVRQTSGGLCSTLDYTVRITNNGNAASLINRVSNLIPAGTEYVTGSLKINGRSINSNPVSGLDLGEMQTGETAEISYQVKVVAVPNGGVFTNQARLDYSYRLVANGDLITGQVLSNNVGSRYDSTLDQCDNQPPVANDDNLTIPKDSSVYSNPLTNDTDPNNNLDPNTLKIVDQPDHGQIEIINGILKYTPAPGFVGTDTVTYEICDIFGKCDTATITYTIVDTGTNPRPNANNDNATTQQDKPVVIPILQNDQGSNSPIDKTTIVVIDGPKNGSTSINYQTGEITYTPKPGFIGTDTFTYKICNTNNECDLAIATVNVKRKGEVLGARDSINSGVLPRTGGLALFSAITVFALTAAIGGTMLFVNRQKVLSSERPKKVRFIYW
ncbi:MAG: hypothetical protein OHK0017_04380 [Patescibacteria group bacterium]